MKYILFLLFSLLSLTSYAQFEMPDPVKWTFEAQSTGESTFELTYKAKIEEGWNTYSHFTKEGGPLPTIFEYEDKDKIELVGALVETGDIKKAFDETFQMEVGKIKHHAKFVQKVKTVLSTVKGIIDYMVCNDKGCIPLTKEFSFKLPAAVSAKKAAASTIPAVAAIELEENEAQKASPAYRNFDKELLETDCNGESSGKKSLGLLTLFLLGAGGGLIALLTPCVFPMIPITVGYFHQEDKEGTKGKVSGVKNALIFGLSIIAIYVTLGTLFTIIFGADSLTVFSTHWLPNVIFFVIFIVFALSFFGLFEIRLPSSWMNKADNMSRTKGGLVGIFFMAFTLALVSFSCTGPIIGTYLVEAATSPFAIAPIVVMLGFSMALALPFMIFAAFPNTLNSLPQSGGWLNSVKVVLGFLELAFAFKFLSTADLTEHWGLLHYETFLIIWIILGIGLALYLFGIIKFKYDSPLKKLPVWRLVGGLITIALTGYFISGFVNRPLKLLSGLAPPSNYSWFSNKTVAANGLTTCAAGLPCFKDYDLGLAYAKKVNKPMAIDFTGHGCVNCRKIEENVWVDETVNKSLKEDFVLISLYTDDQEKLPKEKQYYSEASGVKKKIRKIGNYWSDFQISNFRSISQPKYILVNSNEKVLAKPFSYAEGKTPEGFMKQLECALSVNESL